jgi:predicted DNA-binding WGR domain protein
MRRVDPETNVARFYVLTLERDLFGNFAVPRQWGRVGTAGRVITEPFGTELEAGEAMGRLPGRVAQRGRGRSMNELPMDAQALAGVIEQAQVALRSCDKLLQHVAAVAAQGGSLSEAQSIAAASIIRMVRELEPDLEVLEQSLTEVGGP